MTWFLFLLLAASLCWAVSVTAQSNWLRDERNTYRSERDKLRRRIREIEEDDTRLLQRLMTDAKLQADIVTWRQP